MATFAAFANGAKGEMLLLPEGGTNLVFGVWEDPKPFVETIISPQVHDFTPYDRCVLDYVYLGEIGESIHMYFAGDKEVFGKDDVLAGRKTIWANQGQWVFRLSGWPKCTDPKQITRIRIRTDYSCGGELWLRRLALLKPSEKLGPTPALTDVEQSAYDAFVMAQNERHVRAFREPRNAFIRACTAVGLDTAGCAIGIADSMSRVRPREGFDAASVRPALSATLDLARGEHEALQVVVMPIRCALKQVCVTCEGAPKGIDVTCSPMGYVKTSSQPTYGLGYTKDGRRRVKATGVGWWPDPILTYTNACDVAVDDVQSFWIDVHAARTAAAGKYGLMLIASDASGLIRKVPFMVAVNDFEIPATSPLPVLVTFNPRPNAATVGKEAAAAIIADPASPVNLWNRHRDEWGDFLADHFVMMDDLYSHKGPYIDQLKRMKEQGRLGDFTIGYWNPAHGDCGYWKAHDLVELKLAYDKCKDAGVLDHGWLYGADEVPIRGIAAVDKAAELLRAAFPGVRIMTTARDYSFGNMATNVYAFCPQTEFYVKHAAALAPARAKGREVWWYVCEQPRAPYANIYLECQPIESRLLMGAMTAKERPDGFLYWEIAYWNSRRPVTGGPFTDWDCTRWRFHGDGCWTCCGPDGIPLPTQRFENFRDGLEDFAYVKLVEAKYGRRVEIPQNIMRSMEDYTDDPQTVRAWRGRLAEALAK